MEGEIQGTAKEGGTPNSLQNTKERCSREPFFVSHIGS